MALLAQVYISDIPYHADKPYTYYVPETIQDTVFPGSVVDVPFGKGNRRVTGIVTALSEGEVGEDYKPIASAVTEDPILNEEMLGLCLFLKDYTLCTFWDALRTVVPSAAISRVITYYRIVPEMEGVSIPKGAMEALGDRGQQVYELACRRKKFTRQYLQTELEFDCTRSVMTMLEWGLCEKCTEIRPHAETPHYRMLQLPECLREKEAYGAAMGQLRSENQKKLFAALADGGRVRDSVLYESLGMKPAAGRTAVAALEKKGFLTVTVEENFRNPFTPEALMAAERETSPNIPTLSQEQTAAKNTLVSLYESGEPCAALLHGVTGSGKTAVIMAAIDRVLEDGRGVIMLIPEIALTPQTVGLFVRRYGERIAVIHSGLSVGERYDAWRRIRDGMADVVIGTRSAIFAPLRNIGMIVIDEEHEYTYKSDTDPKYHAHDIARYRCRDHRAVMVLSSATPSVTSYYKAKTGVYTLVELKERYGNAVLPEVQIYDMRGESARGNLSPVGSLLEQRLREDRAAGNQSILFLNRRGYHNYVSCRACGVGVKCPSCSVTLTYHAKKRRLSTPEGEDLTKQRREDGYLTCHFCGYRSGVPEKCPECGKDHFLFMGAGTQKAEDDIASLLPDLRVLRMDLDTTQAKFSHEEILSKFRRGEADVLLGTQMVTKGHDFPRVATVGVLNADSTLQLEDYRAGERTFAMLTQVIGRAGRGDIPGVAVIQTYNPANDVILMAAKQDYPTFYEGEIRLRKALCFPPFCDIAVITLSSNDEGYLNLVITRMHERIIEHTRETFSDVPLVLYGPFEAPVYRVQNQCRMRLVLKCRLNRRTRAFLSELMCEFGKSGPVDAGKKTVSAKSSRRIAVSVDLNPSTV